MPFRFSRGTRRNDSHEGEKRRDGFVTNAPCNGKKISLETRQEGHRHASHLWFSWPEISRFSPFGPSCWKRQTRGASGRRRATGQRDADSGPFGGFLNRGGRARPRRRRADVVRTRFRLRILAQREPSNSSGERLDFEVTPANAGNARARLRSRATREGSRGFDRRA